MAVPLSVKEQVVGALGLVDVAGRIFSVEDVQLARALGRPRPHGRERQDFSHLRILQRELRVRA